MALPPERITVKRRRDEEPVDALYVHPKKSRKTIVWNRVPSDDENSGPIQSLPSAHGCGKDTQDHGSQIPTVRTTLPKEDFIALGEASCTTSRHAITNEVSQNSVRRADKTTKLATSVTNDRNRSPNRPPKEPRKFLFTRPGDSSRTPSVFNSRIAKTRKKQKKEYAVFVERTDHRKEPRRRGKYRASNHKNSNPLGDHHHGPTYEPLTLRKRPLASQAEKEWRAQTWKQPPESKVRARLDIAGAQNIFTADDSAHEPSLCLAHQLQQFALEETRAANKAHDIRKVPRAKVKPKPPRPRPAREEPCTTESGQDIAQEGMDSSNDEEAAGNFILDVYVRQNGHDGEKVLNKLQTNALKTTNPDRIGMLVIEDEDQEIWELYGQEDQISDEDWNSEEEDENAEDYYGNDYPDDELDSDDEYDRDIYEHWQGAFDEDDLEEHVDWSDDELEEKQPWRLR
ncbi:MAG: hypothetical protein Q9181_000669 [Wetmoreana brouardii]